jgi:Delta24-sterol reductase
VGETIEFLRQEASDKTHDYVDGILFSKDHGVVVVTGEMTDEEPPPSRVQTFSHAADPWFYMHVCDRTRSASGPVVEFIPPAEYLFRYDRGGFWVGASAFDYFKFPFNSLTRWFLDDFLHTKRLYEALLSGRESSRYVVQDLALPYSRAEAFVDYTAHKLGIWPLGLCPILQTPPPTFHAHVADAEGPQFLHVGLWGFGPRDQAAFVESNRDLERRLQGDFVDGFFHYPGVWRVDSNVCRKVARSWVQ